MMLLAPALVAVLVAVGLSRPVPQETEPPPLSCSVILPSETRTAADAYREIVRLYRHRRDAEALARLKGWPSKNVDRAVGAFVILGHHRECLQANRLELRDVEAAALLETDRALAVGLPPGDDSERTERGRDLSRADKLMEAATTPEAPERRCRWLQGLALYSYGRVELEDAEQRYAKSLSLCPEDAAALISIGLVHEVQGTRLFHGAVGVRDPRAASVYEKNDGERAPTAPLTRLTIAENYYRRALQVVPDQVEAHLRLAHVWQAQRRLGEARAEIEALLARPKLEPRVVYVSHLMLGGMSEAEGKMDEAARSYRAALAAEPDAQVATLALSHALHRSGARAEAGEIVERWLTRAKAEEPAEVDEWLWFQWGAAGRAANPQEWMLGPLREELAR
jgi:tetratricopeptide (TPR) repeat protein